MPRRSKGSPDLPPLLMMFLIVPWYVGPIVAAIAYSVLRWFVPWFWPVPKDLKTVGDGINMVFGAFAQNGPSMAPIVAALIIFVWIIAEIAKFARRLHEGDIEWPSFRRHQPIVESATGHGLAPSPPYQPRTNQTVSNSGTSMAVPKPTLKATTHGQVPKPVPTTSLVQTSATDGQIDISKMDWKQFEKLLVQVLRRFGFETEHTGRNGPDGGFDVRCIDSKGQTFLVQVKHWRSKEVDVTTVREFLGVLVHERVSIGLIVTSGIFTHPAKQFAKEKPLRLIDGEKLLKVLAEVPEYCDGEKLRYRISHLESLISSEQCPRCTSRMIRKTGRHGMFLGCERYPDCKGTRKTS